jgi:hypothetical protein
MKRPQGGSFVTSCHKSQRFKSVHLQNQIRPLAGKPSQYPRAGPVAQGHGFLYKGAKSRACDGQ